MGYRLQVTGDRGQLSGAPNLELLYEILSGENLTASQRNEACGSGPSDNLVNHVVAGGVRGNNQAQFKVSLIKPGGNDFRITITHARLVMNEPMVSRHQNAGLILIAIPCSQAHDHYGFSVNIWIRNNHPQVAVK